MSLSKPVFQGPNPTLPRSSSSSSPEPVHQNRSGRQERKRRKKTGNRKGKPKAKRVKIDPSTRPPECRAFQKCFAVLSDGISNLECLAAELYSKELIARDLHKKVIKHQATIRGLLSAVEDQIVANPATKFKVFLNVLRNEPSLHDLAATLEKSYCEILDSDSTSTHFVDSELPHSTTPSNRPPITPVKASPIETYASYLRSVYTQDKLPVYDKWPGVKSKKYINPVLISKQPITEQERDDLVRSTVYGNIDAIKQTTRKIDICHIAQPADESLSECILVEGAPGVGKSTLAWKLCYEWGKGELLQQYQLVVLLRLRDETVQVAKNISDLFQYHDHQIPQAAVEEMQKTAQAAVEEIQKTGGKGVLLLFEGYDELPETLRTSSSIFLKVITGRKLHKATILVTSRPWASEFLLRQSRHISQRIEIMGFSESNIQSYLESITADDLPLLNDLKTYMSCYPHINSLMYSPLNCAIVVEVYRRGRKDNCFLLKTITDLYSSLVRTLLLRHLFEQNEGRSWRIRSFNDLPSDVKKQFCELGRVAYEGIVQETQVVFSDLPENFETLGLMNCASELHIDEGVALSYNFLHLTVQEYLAAFHLSLQPVDEQIEHFQKYGKHSKQHHECDDKTSVKEQGSEDDRGSDTSNESSREDSGDEDNRLQLSNSDDDLMNYGEDYEDEDNESDGSTDNEVSMTVSSSVDVVCSDDSSGDDSSREDSDEKDKEYIDESASEHSSDSESEDNSMEYDDDGDSVGDSEEESTNAKNDDCVNQECGNHFQNVLKFLSGLSKFSGYGEALESLIKVYPENGSEDGTVTAVVTLNSLHWLFETQEIAKILGLSSVKVDEHTCDLTPFDCYVLGYCVSHSNCRWKIDLKSCSIGDEGVEKLVQGIRTVEYNTQFTGSISEINLSDNDITCKGMSHLLKIPKCLRREIETVNISLNDIDSKFYIALSKLISDIHHLKSFYLNGIWNPESMMRGDVICSEFLASLTAQHSLEDLSLVWTGIGKESKECQALCKLLSRLRKLCVSHLPCDSVELIVNQVDGHTTLKSLYMADSGFSHRTSNSLASALRRNHTIINLILRRCNIDSEEACQIASALCTNDTLQTLWLESNSIESLAAAEFAKMLDENKSLKQLNLQRNPIGEEGTQNLIDSLEHNTSLEKLYLPECYKPVTVPAWCRSRVVFRLMKYYTPL